MHPPIIYRIYLVYKDYDIWSILMKYNWKYELNDQGNSAFSNNK